MTLIRLLLFPLLFAACTGSAVLAATTSAKEKTSVPSKVTAKPNTAAKTEAKPSVPRPAAVATLSIEDISGFETYPKQIQSLVQSALALTHLELRYLYGSHEPSKGGMDCSGTVYHLLHFQGIKGVPRQSDEMCQWVDQHKQLHLTPTATNFDSEEFNDLKPGDLLFWTNTTATQRKLPVTHVMIYLGKLKQSGKRIVFGASDGRSYQGERRSGVSVFDFSLPRTGNSSRFYGYGATPGLVPTPEVKTPIILAATPKVELAAPVAVEKPAAPKEEVRKAVALADDAKLTSPVEKLSLSTAVPDKEVSPIVAVEPSQAAEQTTLTDKPEVKAEVKKAVSSSSTNKATVKPKSAAKKTTVAKRRAPAPPPQNKFERNVDQAISSIRRYLR